MPSTYPPRQPKKGHYIANIRARGSSKDFIECACRWRGSPADYNAHRLAGNRPVRS